MTLYQIDPVKPDEKDRVIAEQRSKAFARLDGPEVGDWVVFIDKVRRVSYVWEDYVQTSDNGSWFLGNGYVSFSGSLFTGVPVGRLTRTDRTQPGDFWFFHHDWAQGENGVGVRIPCRVWIADCGAPST